MAKFTVTGLDDVQEAMLRRDKATMEAVPEMLKAGGEVIKNAFQAETKKLNSTGRGTGDLTASIKVSAVKERNGGKYVDIAPTGKDRHGVRNAEKGFVLNYGRSNMPGATVVHGGERKSGGRSDGRNAPRLGGKAK